MKVYILIEDWASDGNGCGVSVKTYATRELAQKALAEAVESVKKNIDYDTIDEVEGDYFDYYNEGWYDNQHEHLAIEEQEIIEKMEN